MKAIIMIISGRYLHSYMNNKPTEKNNMLCLINKIVATCYKQY